MLPVFKFNRPVFADDFITRNLFNGLFDSDGEYRTPAVNVKEGKENVQIELAAPGLAKEDFKVNLNNRILTISCEKESKEEEEVNYTSKEFEYKSFTRSFTLSNTVDSENISASYKDGILYVTVPKKEEAKVKPAREIAIA
jgi:HSP20 family protein